MATITATSDQVSLPTCTVTRETSSTTGRSTYVLSVEILGIDPNRSLTAEERTLGITSLSPPTVRGQRIPELIQTLIDATANAYDATDGYTIDGEILASISHRVSRSALQALREIGEDV